jgi:hypothetical protein
MLGSGSRIIEIVAESSPLSCGETASTAATGKTSDSATRPASNQLLKQRLLQRMKGIMSKTSLCYGMLKLTVDS